MGGENGGKMSRQKLSRQKIDSKNLLGGWMDGWVDGWVDGWMVKPG